MCDPFAGKLLPFHRDALLYLPAVQADPNKPRRTWHISRNFLTTLDKYISAHANRSIAVILLALTALISLFGLYEELDENQSTYGMREALLYIFSTLPRRLDEVLVYSAFLGYLIAFGRLAETHELTVMRTSGMSPARIMRALIPSLALWIIANIMISEFVAPPMDRKANADKIQAQFGSPGQRLEVGLWLKIEDLYMHVQAIDERGDIWGVTQHKVSDQRVLQQVVSAASGRYRIAEENWLFDQVKVVSFNGNQSTTQTFDDRIWPNSITPEQLASRAYLEPNKMSMFNLYQQIDNSPLDRVSEHEIAFWQRLLRPLVYISMCLFALAVVLGPLRQVGAGTRITFGIFAGVAFKYLQDLFAPAAIVFQIPAWLGVSIPVAVCAVIAFIVIRRSA